MGEIEILKGTLVTAYLWPWADFLHLQTVLLIDLYHVTIVINIFPLPRLFFTDKHQNDPH